MNDILGVSRTGHKFYQLSPKQWRRVEYQYISLFGLIRVLITEGLNIFIAVTVTRGALCSLISIYQIRNSVVLPYNI
jgi:hypothetical protein